MQDYMGHKKLRHTAHYTRDWALLREWGRIGSAGRLVSSRFASQQEAALAMAGHLKAKLRKGYEAV
jgi:predicted DNA-binding WGR domain protein